MASGTCSRPRCASWSKLSKLQVDGPRSTNPLLSVTIDSHGRIVAVFGANSGTDTTTRNYPVLSHSNDGAAWKTCGPAFTVAIGRYYPRRVKTSPGCS